MNYALCNRRKDSELRDAIDRLHDKLRSLTTSEDIYSATLQEVCFLTSSPVVFAINFCKDDKRSFFTCACIIHNGETRKFDPSLKLLSCNDTQTLNRAIAFNYAVVLDQSTIKSLGKLLPSLPSLKQVLTIPIGDTYNAHGLLCLANASTPYHTDLAKRLWPLLATCTSLLRLTESRHLQTVSEKRLLEDQHSWHTIYQQVEMFSPVGMITLDAEENRILHMNPAAERMFAINHEMALGLPITELIPNCNQSQSIPAFLQISREHPNPLLEVDGKTANGTRISLEVSRLHYFDGKAYRVLLMLRDSTDLIHAQNRHEEELGRFQALADLAPMGILQSNRDWRVDYVNQRWLDIIGSNGSDIHNRSWLDILESSCSHLLTNLNNAISNGREFNGECSIQTKNGCCFTLYHYLILMVM